MSIVDIYKTTSEAYGRVCNEGGAEAWEEVLRNFPESEIKRAITEHQGDTSQDADGRVLGKWMPSPAEIKSRVLRARDEQEKAISGKFQPCRNCDSGWVRVSSGLTHGGNQVDAKHGAVRRCECFHQWAALRKTA